MPIDDHSANETSSQRRCCARLTKQNFSGHHHDISILQLVSLDCYDRLCPTVWPSVCYTLVSCQNDSSYDHVVFTGGI